MDKSSNTEPLAAASELRRSREMSKTSFRFSQQEGCLKERPNEVFPRVNYLQLEGKAVKDKELKSKADSLRESVRPSKRDALQATGLDTVTLVS